MAGVEMETKYCLCVTKKHAFMCGMVMNEFIHSLQQLSSI